VIDFRETAESATRAGLFKEKYGQIDEWSQ
jgi:hypothetical protein